MRSWGRSARGEGPLPGTRRRGWRRARRPPGPPRAALCLCARLGRSRPRSRPALGRPRPLLRPPRSLSLLRVVTKHYKKAGRAVPGIGGRGAASAYIPASAASAAAPTHTPAPPPPLRPSSRRGPSPRPRRPARGRAGGRAGAPAKPEGRAREAPLWTSPPPTSGRSAGRRCSPRGRLALGTVGGAAPRPETSFRDQVGRRGAAWSGAGGGVGGGSLVPGAFPGFPSPSRVIPGREGTR